jgi:hypothetical protein
MSETSRHHRSLNVPAAQAPAVLEALVTTYAVRADALAAAAGAGPLAAVHDARRELAEVEDALDAVGWALARELSGPGALVREVLYAALLAAVDACGERCRDYDAGRVGRDVLAAAVADVAVLHGLFAEVEAVETL